MAYTAAVNAEINVEKQVEYWRKGGQEDWDVGADLVRRGKSRHGLFFVHLAIEKTIKAVVVANTGEMPPKSHDLLRLAALARLSLDDERRSALSQISRYCLEGRYPDTWGGPPDEEEARVAVLAAESVSAWLQTMFEKK